MLNSIVILGQQWFAVIQMSRRRYLSSIAVGGLHELVQGHPQGIHNEPYLTKHGVVEHIAPVKNEGGLHYRVVNLLEIELSGLLPLER